MAPVKRAVSTTAANKSEPVDNISEFESFVTKRPKSGSGRKGGLVTFIIIIILLVAAAWWFYGRNINLGNTAGSKEFKAVALDNGQVYYAQIDKRTEDWIYLTEVYYIQSEERTVPAEEEGAEDTKVTVPVLVKRGQELHKPTGYLELNRDRVVGIETIGQDSEIYLEIQRIQQGGASQ